MAKWKYYNKLKHQKRKYESTNFRVQKVCAWYKRIKKMGIF